MRHEDLACARVELLEVAQAASCAHRVLPHPPKAFDGLEMGATMGREDVEAKCALGVVEGRITLRRSMEPAPLDNPPHLLLGFPEGGHPWVDIWAPLLGLTVRHDCLADLRGAIVAGTDNAEPHAAREAAPGAIRQPRLAFEAGCALAVALAPGTGGQTRALGCAPPSCPGQGKAPHDRFVCREHHALTPAGLGLQGRACARARGEISRGGLEPSSGTAGAWRVFFTPPRTLARPSGLPVCGASPVARARHFPWEEREPCWRGS